MMRTTIKGRCRDQDIWTVAHVTPPRVETEMCDCNTTREEMNWYLGARGLQNPKFSYDFQLRNVVLSVIVLWDSSCHPFYWRLASICLLTLSSTSCLIVTALHHNSYQPYPSGHWWRFSSIVVASVPCWVFCLNFINSR